MPRVAILGGNSVGFDRAFLLREMPLVTGHCKYQYVLEVALHFTAVLIFAQSFRYVFLTLMPLLEEVSGGDSLNIQTCHLSW